MNIINKNEGTYIPYTLQGNILSFADELTLFLNKYERDNPVHIDICQDKFGNLVMGVIPGVAETYVAEIDIPAREYTEVDSGEVDDYGNEIYTSTPVPYNPDNTTLTLWGLEE